MSRITTEVLIIVLLVLANGLFAMAEIAVVSARKARLKNLANQGDKRAEAALELANSPNRFLSTVQIGITLVGIFAGAFGGATVAQELADYLGTIDFLAPYSTALGLGIVVVAITYLSLVIGELVPKRLALHSPERIASLVARPMSVLSRLAAPVVHLLSLSTEAVLRLLGVQPSAEAPVTEEEIQVLVEQGTEAGMIEEAERDMVASIFRLGDRRVEALMTPRTEITWIDINDPPEMIQEVIEDSNHSRFPVCDDSLDNVLGVVLVKDLLSRSMTGEPLDLRAIMKRPPFIPESMPALKVLEVFRQSGMHMALLIDEYGGIAGLVTLVDILEAIVGDIPTPEELVEPPVVQREDGSWLIDGLLPIDEFKELFHIRNLPDEDNYQTLGGFMVLHIGRIPAPSDHFEWHGLRFEVVDMDGNRVDKVLVASENPPSPQSNHANNH
ncbi:MAG TPA: hemolysin family protein [Anaerolineae bacterium]